MAHVAATDLDKETCVYDWLTNPKEEYRSIIEAIRNETDNERVKKM
jgi:hypothetical protein